jgi:hypothetical protein
MRRVRESSAEQWLKDARHEYGNPFSDKLAEAQWGYSMRAAA